jgi:phosphate transport system protein
MVASDAAFNSRDFLAGSSRMALLSVRDCERELDRIEQEIDERLPAAITNVDEPDAREFLACLRFSTELERIGDLLWGAVRRVQSLQTRLSKSDLQHLIAMISILEHMLQGVRQGFEDRELERADYVLRADREIDRVYKAFFQKNVAAEDEKKAQQRAEVLMIAGALERAGDHATNLAEELFRLIQGRSLRHVVKKQLKD